MTAAPPDPAPASSPAPEPTHLYDAVAAQRDEVVGGFADQREALVRAVEEQRLAAMPRHMRLAALSPAQTSAEIVLALRQFVTKEVTRQLHMAITAMMTERVSEKEKGSSAKEDVAD